MVYWGNAMNRTSQKRLCALLSVELPILRASIRISQDELSKRIGISRQTYSLIETGKQEMTWITFMALLAFFGNNQRSKNILQNMDFYNDPDFLECVQYLK